MKSDAQLKKDVEAELEWDPSVNAAHVGVSVNAGVVTLTGHLDTFAEKYLVEHAVQRVTGVKALAVELDVRLATAHVRSDSDIARAVESTLQWHAQIPSDRIQVKVEKGWVTLRGEVMWDFERRTVEKAVRPLTGVVGVHNLLTLRNQTTPANIDTRIREALMRHARREADSIEVSVSGDSVTLRGRVQSLSERNLVQGAAWSAPGITQVHNELQVGVG